MGQTSYAVKLTEQKLSSVTDLKYYGLLLRDHRFRLGLTLEEVSIEICAPSHLSRLEKGTALPNPSLFNKLCSRLQIPTHSEVSYHHDWLSPFRLALHQHDLKLLEKLIQRNSDIYYYQKVLQSFVFDIVCLDPKHLKKTYNSLLSFQDYMPAEELELFYHYVGRYYELLFQPELALHYFRLALRLNKHSIKKDALLFLNLAQFYFKCGVPNRGIHHLQDALAYFTDEHFIKYKIDCELLLCYYYIKSQIYGKAAPLLNKLYYLLKFNDSYHNFSAYLLILGHYHTEKQQYLEAERRYHQALNLNPQVKNGTLALLELYHSSNDFTKQRAFIKMLQNESSSHPPSLTIQINYYHFLCRDHSTEAFRIFLQKEAIPNAIQTANYNYYYKYSTSLIQYYDRIGKYKSALKLYQKLKEQNCLTPFMN